jgi:hypothetical protein
MASLLFLDDDLERHRRFHACIETRGYLERYRIIYAFSAADAIQALRDHEGDIVQAFLDHDLSEDDLLVALGEPTRVPTGMTVVDHILTMKKPPEAIVVHSLNYDAAVEMCARLSSISTIAVRRVPFSQLLSQIS